MNHTVKEFRRVALEQIDPRALDVPTLARTIDRYAKLLLHVELGAFDIRMSCEEKQALLEEVRARFNSLVRRANELGSN